MSSPMETRPGTARGPSEMDGDRMTCRRDMAAVGQALVFHLEATLERVADPG